MKRRRSIRLRGYDYAGPGAYFVTVSTQQRACLFGKVAAGEMVLNDAGRIAKQCWLNVPKHFPHIELDEFVIMPNRIRGIWVIADSSLSPDAGIHVGANVGAKDFSPLHGGNPSAGTSKTIGSAVRGFKIGVTKWMRANTDVHDVWQRNYYEHIIRGGDALRHSREYIVDNPARWAFDREHPEAVDVRRGRGECRGDCRGEKFFAPTGTMQ